MSKMSLLDQNYFIFEAITAHNDYRLLHGAPPLVHNPNISQIALNWANKLAKTNSFEHSQNLFNNERLGESLAMSSESVANWGILLRNKL